MDMQPRERDRSGIGVVHVERHGPAVDDAVRIAANFCCDPSRRGRIDAGNRRNFICSAHESLEVIRLFRELRSDNTGRKLRGVDIDVVVFGILNQPPQEIERGVGRTDRYLPIDGAKTVVSHNCIGRVQSGVDHDGPVNADFPIMNV